MPGLLREPAVRDALAVTLRTNLIANALILGFGTPTAWLLAAAALPGPRARGHAGRAAARAAAGGGRASACSPPSGRGGLFGATLRDAGIELPFTEAAVVLAVTFVASPFYIRQAISAFEVGRPERSPTPRARSAPARRGRSGAIGLPLAAGGLLAGWVLAFARGIGEFGATIIFAGNVRGQTQTLTLTIYEQLESNLDVALAIGVLLVVLSGGVLLSYKMLSSWRRSSSTSPSPFARSSSASA